MMDLDGGTGFDRGFLTEAVNPPGCDPADLLVVDGQVELRYMHFSVAMHAGRRLARWVAWNIDGITRWDGDDIPRDGMRFVPDPRVPAAAQTTEAVYTRNRLDGAGILSVSPAANWDDLERWVRLGIGRWLGRSWPGRRRGRGDCRSPAIVG